MLVLVILTWCPEDWLSCAFYNILAINSFILFIQVLFHTHSIITYIFHGINKLQLHYKSVGYRCCSVMSGGYDDTDRVRSGRDQKHRGYDLVPSLWETLSQHIRECGDNDFLPTGS